MENGAFQEWLEELLGTMVDKGETDCPAYRAGENIRGLLKLVCHSRVTESNWETKCVSEMENGQKTENSRVTEKQDQTEHGGIPEDSSDHIRQKDFWMRLYRLLHDLAQVPVADMEALERQAERQIERRKKNDGRGDHEERTGEILLSGKRCVIPLCPGDKRFRNGGMYNWKKLVNITSFPVQVQIEYRGSIVSSRLIGPGGFAWFLERDGGFVKWGRRVQVHHRAFACVDRNGRLTVNGRSMRGDGMVDFSFDGKTGILGVDSQCELRQYSALELGTEAMIAFAWLRKDKYLLVDRNGKICSNLSDRQLDIFRDCSRETELEEIGFNEGLFRDLGVEIDGNFDMERAGELPWPAVDASVSEQLIAFETAAGLTGVWDREQKRLIWAEDGGMTADE